MKEKRTGESEGDEAAEKAMRKEEGRAGELQSIQTSASLFFPISRDKGEGRDSALRGVVQEWRIDGREGRRGLGQGRPP